VLWLQALSLLVAYKWDHYVVLQSRLDRTVKVDHKAILSTKLLVARREERVAKISRDALQSLLSHFVVLK
jgi:hypothetical protein